MKKKIILTILVSSVLFSSNVFATDDMAMLKSGKPIVKETVDPNSKATVTQLVFLVKATPDKVWNVLMDCDNYPKFMPVKSYKYKARKGSYDIVSVEPEAPAMFSVNYDMKRVYDKKDWKITFSKSAGKIKNINGWWKLEPVESGKYTKVTYVNNVDIGVPIPGFVKDYFAKGSLLKVADGVKKRVESGETWSR